MESGFGYFPTHDAVDPATLARWIEQRGHAALLFAEHTHIPVGDGHPPDAAGGPLKRRYWHTYDLMIACTASGLATTRLRVGSAICLVPQHEPIGMAKSVASVDHLTGGRFEFGIGAGWNEPEIRNHGIDPAHRFAIMREYVEAMQQIWTHDRAAYHGKFVSFDPIFSWPKPVQTPQPPILIGGAGPRVVDRVLAYGDVWIPNYDERVLQRAAELRSRAADLGKSVKVYVMLSARFDPRVLESLEAAGIERAMLWLPSAGPDRIERAMDAFEAALADLRGE
jgi:probable F420-dependent oxidoreductase